MCVHYAEVAVPKAGGGLSPESDLAGTLMLDFEQITVCC